MRRALMSWTMTAERPTTSATASGSSSCLYFSSFFFMTSCMVSLASLSTSSRKTTVPLRVDMPSTMPNEMCSQRFAHSWPIRSSILNSCWKCSSCCAATT